MGGLRSVASRGLWNTIVLAGARFGRPGSPAPSSPESQSAVPQPQGKAILVIDAMTPDATRDSGSLRLMEILRILRTQGFLVFFMPDGGHPTPAGIRALAAIGVQPVGIGGQPDLPTWLARNAANLVGVMLCRHYVAARHIDLIRHFAPSATVVLDTVDLHFLRERRSAELSGDRKALVAAERTRRSELQLAMAADATFVVSEPERCLLDRLLPGKPVHVLSNIHHLKPACPGPGGRSGMLFVGGFGHPPNRDAVLWLVDDILPRIREQIPDMELHLVGDIPDEEAVALGRPGVIVHGRIEDLGPLMARARMAVAPLRVGAGVKGKVNSAMSYGLPVIATSIAAEGMFIRDGEEALVADTADDFAGAAIRLNSDDATWRRLSQGGRENIRRHFSAESAEATLNRVFRP